jgi:hypothetical protein
LVVRSPLHSPSSSKREEGKKKYNEKIQFGHLIIQGIFISRTSEIEFLHKCKKGWSSSE